MKSLFEANYPTITGWVKDWGWIEIGSIEYGLPSFIRALDKGGVIWEGDEDYRTIDQALNALEAALQKWLEKNH